MNFIILMIIIIMVVVVVVNLDEKIESNEKDDRHDAGEGARAIVEVDSVVSHRATGLGVCGHDHNGGDGVELKASDRAGVLLVLLNCRVQLSEEQLYAAGGLVDASGDGVLADLDVSAVDRVIDFHRGFDRVPGHNGGVAVGLLLHVDLEGGLGAGDGGAHLEEGILGVRGDDVEHAAVRGVVSIGGRGVDVEVCRASFKPGGKALGASGYRALLDKRAHVVGGESDVMTVAGEDTDEGVLVLLAEVDGERGILGDNLDLLPELERGAGLGGDMVLASGEAKNNACEKECRNKLH